MNKQYSINENRFISQTNRQSRHQWYQTKTKKTERKTQRQETLCKKICNFDRPSHATVILSRKHELLMLTFWFFALSRFRPCYVTVTDRYYVTLSVLCYVAVPAFAMSLFRAFAVMVPGRRYIMVSVLCYITFLFCHSFDPWQTGWDATCSIYVFFIKC